MPSTPPTPHGIPHAALGKSIEQARQDRKQESHEWHQLDLEEVLAGSEEE